MAEPFLFWDEIEEERLPSRCVRCGRRPATFTPYRIRKTRWMVVFNQTISRTIQIPFCQEHKGGGLSLTPVVALNWDEEGVWLVNVHPRFVDALEELRQSGENGGRAGKRQTPAKPSMALPWTTLAIVGGIFLLIVLCMFFCVCAGMLIQIQQFHK